jgi:hypothetical protein
MEAFMKQYKNRLILMAAVILSLSLSACGGNTQSEESNTSTTNQTEESVTVTSESDQATISSSVEEQQENVTTETNASTSQQEGEETMNITLTVNGTTLTAELTDNSSAEALKEMLADGPLTVEMSDYAGMEKVGSLGKSLPTNDEEITTDAGDLILYQGDQLVIYYAPNSWNFTRLGKIQDVTASELYEILGSGDVEVTLALAE